MKNMLSAGEINDFVAPQRFGKKGQASQGGKRKNGEQVEKQSLARGILRELLGSSGLGGRLYHCCGSGHLKRFPPGQRVLWLGSICRAGGRPRSPEASSMRLFDRPSFSVSRP